MNRKFSSVLGALSLIAVIVSPPARIAAQETATNPPGTLSVTFVKLRSTRGVLRVTLFDSSQEGKGFPGDAKKARESKVIELSKAVAEGAKETTVTFSGLVGGTYAVAAFHDENNNNKMDMHWYGKPKEGSAASNDPRPKMRAPRWNEAKFTLPESGKSINVAMWYP